MPSESLLRTFSELELPLPWQGVLRAAVDANPEAVGFDDRFAWAWWPNGFVVTFTAGERILILGSSPGAADHSMKLWSRELSLGTGPNAEALVARAIPLVFQGVILIAFGSTIIALDARDPESRVVTLGVNPMRCFVGGFQVGRGDRLYALSLPLSASAGGYVLHELISQECEDCPPRFALPIRGTVAANRSGFLMHDICVESDLGLTSTQCGSRTAAPDFRLLADGGELFVVHRTGIDVFERPDLSIPMDQRVRRFEAPLRHTLEPSEAFISAASGRSELLVALASSATNEDGKPAKPGNGLRPDRRWWTFGASKSPSSKARSPHPFGGNRTFPHGWDSPSRTSVAAAPSPLKATPGTNDALEWTWRAASWRDDASRADMWLGRRYSSMKSNQTRGECTVEICDQSGRAALGFESFKFEDSAPLHATRIGSKLLCIEAKRSDSEPTEPMLQVAAHARGRHLNYIAVETSALGAMTPAHELGAEVRMTRHMRCPVPVLGDTWPARIVWFERTAQDRLVAVAAEVWGVPQEQKHEA